MARTTYQSDVIHCHGCHVTREALAAIGLSDCFCLCSVSAEEIDAVVAADAVVPGEFGYPAPVYRQLIDWLTRFDVSFEDCETIADWFVEDASRYTQPVYNPYVTEEDAKALLTAFMFDIAQIELGNPGNPAFVAFLAYNMGRIETAHYDHIEAQNEARNGGIR